MSVDLAALRALAEQAIATDDGIAPDLYRELPPQMVRALVEAVEAARIYLRDSRHHCPNPPCDEQETLAAALAPFRGQPVSADGDGGVSVREKLAWWLMGTTKVYVHNSRVRLERARLRLDEFRKAQG